LGIDFGTTRTVVAAAIDGRYPIACFDTGDALAEYVPGVVAATDDGLVFGWRAAAALRSGAPGLRSLKREIAQLAPDEPVPELAPRGSSVDVLTGFVTELRRQLLAAANLELSAGDALEAMIAVPANASTRQRYVTMEAFTRAGFEVLGLINEPTAAAVELAHRHLGPLGPRSPKRYAVIYDLGGGTFDTAAVSLRERRFELLASDGLARLGGDDFDELVLALALEAAGAPASALRGRARVAALEACRQAKETLHPNSRRLLVDLAAVLPEHEPSVIDAGELFARAAPLVEATLAPVARVLERLSAHGIDTDDPRELGGVYLVGGAVQFPPVLRRLRAVYGRKLQLALQPHAATAAGLAVCADPAAGVFVREATTRHFGVWREADNGRAKVFDTIFSKDTQVADEPVVTRRRYRPMHTIGALRFMECASLSVDGQPAGDVTPWRRVHFPYAPELADADEAELAERPVERRDDLTTEVTETYVYRADGTIAVDIEARPDGHARHLTLGRMR
jgi:molecular chaperone DnaK (HSP70)